MCIIYRQFCYCCEEFRDTEIDECCTVNCNKKLTIINSGVNEEDFLCDTCEVFKSCYRRQPELSAAEQGHGGHAHCSLQQQS